MDTIILGRKLAEGFIPYWAANTKLEGADKINNAKKIIFTKTLDKSVWTNSELAKGDLNEEIKNLKKSAGGDIIVYGGGAFVSSLIKTELIDEYHLFINPVALGTGITIFKDLSERLNLALIKATAFDCGIIVLNYAPRPV